MTRYIIRRLIQMLPSLLLILAIVFTVFRLVPGDPVMLILGPNADPAAYAAVKHRMGLDRPIPVQFAYWLRDAVTGNLGESRIGKEGVAFLVRQKLPATLELAVLGMLIGSLVGVPIGILSALKQDSWLDAVARIFSLLGFCTPGYWLAILLVIVFSLHFRWLPAGGYVSLGENWRQNLRYVVLPALTIGLPIAAEQMRFLRSSMLDVIRQDYIRTARAKGLQEHVIVVRHALKNAFIPFLTIFGMELAFLLGGSVVIEQIFSWPGLGWMTVESIHLRDYAVVQGTVFFSAMAFMFINLAVDIAYSFLDPRIRYQ